MSRCIACNAAVSSGKELCKPCLAAVYYAQLEENWTIDVPEGHIGCPKEFFADYVERKGLTTSWTTGVHVESTAVAEIGPQTRVRMFYQAAFAKFLGYVDNGWSVHRAAEEASGLAVRGDQTDISYWNNTK